MIEHISASNVKGYTFQHPLYPVTIFIGGHRRGKTSRLEAIRLLLYGYSPHIGKMKTGLLFGAGETMDVVGRLRGEPEPITRGWRREEGSIKASPKGKSLSIPEILGDSRPFFAMTPNARTQWVFDQVKLDPAKYSSTALITKIKQLKCDPHTESHESVLGDLVLSIVDSAGALRSGLSLQEWLANELDDCSERLRSAKKTVERMEGTVAGLTELGTKSEVDTLPEAAVIQKSLDEMLKRKGELQTSLGQVLGKITAEAKSAERRAAIEATLAAPVEVIPAMVIEQMAKAKATLDSYQSRLEKAMTELGGCQALRQESRAAEVALIQKLNELEFMVAEENKKATRREQMQSAMPPDMSEQMLAVQQEMNETNNAIQTYQSKTPEVRERFNQAAAAIVNKDALVNRLRDERSQKSRDADVRRKLGLCEDCQKKLLVPLTKELDRLVEATEAAKNELTVMALAQDQLKVELDAAIAQDRAIEKLSNKVAEFSRKLVDLKTKQNLRDLNEQAIKSMGEPVDYRQVFATAKADVDKAIVTANQAFNALRIAELAVEKAKLEDTEYARLRTELANHEATVVRVNLATNTREALWAELKSLQGAIEPMLREQQASLVIDINRVSADIEITKADLRKAQGRHADNLSKAKADADRKVAVAEVEVISLVMKTIKEYQTEVVDGSFQPFLEDVAGICGPTLGLDFVAREGEIGYLREGVFVTPATMSGFEQAMMFIAFSRALAIESPYKILVMDEMRGIEDVEKREFMRVILDAVKSGSIDQFIGVDTHEGPYINPETVKEHFPGSEGDPVAFGKPYAGIELIKI